MIKYFDNFAEKISFKIAKIFFKLKIKPISVTISRFIISAPVSWYFFTRGEYVYNLIGLFLYMVVAILDWVDGDMAQLYKLPKRTAPLGRLIDHTSDRILMLIVLGSLFYGGMNGLNNQAWIILAILYYSAFFFLTVLMYEFDKTFGIDFVRYPEIGHEMKIVNHSPSKIDKILFNLLYVHNNSLTRIFFTHNYTLAIGIITNQLFLTFVFFTLMNSIRSIGILFLMYLTFKDQKTDSALATVLRKYKIS